MLMVSGCSFGGGKSVKDQNINQGVSEDADIPSDVIEYYDSKDSETDIELTEGEFTQEQADLEEAELAGWIALDEVVQHNTKNDCWVMLHGQIFDVTMYIASHPEDIAILQVCGEDAEALFFIQPKDFITEELLNEYYIGDLWH